MPALNDVTYPELVVMLRDAAKICNVIKQALDDNTLIAMETAQAGPCLDLRYAFLYIEYFTAIITSYYFTCNMKLYYNLIYMCLIILIN